MQINHCLGSGTSAAGAAGAESYIELWNPAASGVDLRVYSVVIQPVETVVKIKYHTSKQGTTALTKGNKTLGGLTPSGELYGNNAASVSGTQVGSLVTVSGVPNAFFFVDPIIVPPGKSLILENTTAAVAITMASLEWDEVVR